MKNIWDEIECDGPDAALEELWDIHICGGPNQFERVLELFTAMDTWLSKGNKPPKSWSKAFKRDDK